MPEPERADLTGDYANAAFLLVLYILQGIPIGLAVTLPLILQEKKVPYADQASLAIASIPFSLKLLWAPLVDGVYLKGARRKSWVIPAQFALGATLAYSAKALPAALDGETPDVASIRNIMLLFYFLCSVQDIAVDGWCLTLLQPRNAAVGSTLNTVGQGIGFHMAYSGYLFASARGWVDLGSFIQLCSTAFVGVTAVSAFIPEGDPSRDDEEVPTLAETGRMAFKIVKNPMVLKYAAVLITMKATFVAVDMVGVLKLVDAGLPKESLSIIAVPSALLDMCVPIVLMPWFSSAGLRAFMPVFRVRWLLHVLGGGLLAVALLNVGGTGDALAAGELPSLFFGSLCVLSVAMATSTTAMFSVQMSFACSKADSSIGGTYMTLLNTIANLAALVPAYLVLKVVDLVTLKAGNPACLALQDKTLCREAQGCTWYSGMDELFGWASYVGLPAPQAELCDEEVLDGIFVVWGALMATGLFGYFYWTSTVHELQDSTPSDWKVAREQRPVARRHSVSRKVA
eukprot:TRINITY_DN47489_c0_g1_i1.p1 TRINITY_DN47489_c0_g1~~TRINITY_DN47489_c0_g1_i1.p1  ORF type:complete len:536 (+),score=161.21 TRINITY_DN47489_c0_g1_i1:67-1608(+)